MAIYGPFYNAKVLVAGTDLSDHVKSITFHQTMADLDTTTMGSAGVHTRTGGLFDGDVAIEFTQDFNTSKVNAVLAAAYSGRVPVAISVNPTNAANSATNPNYSSTVLVNDYTPVGGAVGDLLVTSLTMPLASAVTIATS